MNKPMIVMGLDATLKIGCPNACQYCPQALINSNYKGERCFTLESFQKCLASVPISRHIAFAGHSEPFLCQDAIKIMSWTSHRGHSVAISTTLRGITHYDIDEMAKIPFTDTVIHVPANDNKMKLIVNDEYISLFKHAVSVCKYHTNPIINCAYGPIHPALIPFTENLYICCYTPHSRAGTLTTVPIIKKTGKLPYCGKRLCGSLLPNGNIVRCCNDYEQKNIWGNLFTQTYEEIYKGQPYLNYLKLLETDTDTPCRKCNDDWCKSAMPDTRIIKKAVD